MKRKDVYVGTLKKCINKLSYDLHGDSFYEGHFRIGSIEVGETRKNAVIFSEKEILIKIDDNKYVLLESINSLLDEIKMDLGIRANILYTYPERDGDLFVDKNSLVSYYEQNKVEKVRVKTLKKDVLFNSGIKRK